MHNFDLEPRTTEFAKRVIRLCRVLEKNTMNNRLIGQIVGSAGSIGANYREANDALGKKVGIAGFQLSADAGNHVCTYSMNFYNMPVL